MTEMIGKIKELLNLGVMPLIGIFIFTSLFFFLPDEAITKIGLTEIKTKYRTYSSFGLEVSGHMEMVNILK